MGSFLKWVFSAILIAVWVTAGGFITRANTFIHKNRDKDDKENAGRFKSAWLYSFVAAFITWTLVIIFLILIGLSIFGVITLFSTGIGEAGIAASSIEGGLLKSGAESALKKTGMSWFTILFLIFALFLVVLTGVLSALTAYNLDKSNAFKKDKDEKTDKPDKNKATDKEKEARKDAVIAASICLGTAGLLVIGLGVYIAVSIVRKKKAKKLLEENEKKKAELLERVKQRDYNAMRRKQEASAAAKEEKKPPPLPPRPHSNLQATKSEVQKLTKNASDTLTEATRNALLNSALSKVFGTAPAVD